MDCEAMAPSEPPGAPRVIAVLMSEHKTIDLGRIEGYRRKPFLDFPTGEPGVHHEASVPRLDHNNVAAAT